MQKRVLPAGYLALRRLGLVLVVGALATGCAQPSSVAVYPAPSLAVPSRTDGCIQPCAVPTPVDSAECPAAGVRITAERGDAAMGYREMPLRLTNCGGTAYPLHGRPDIVVLDKDRNRLDIALVPSVHYSAEPRPTTLQPGVSAIAMLSWRNTVTESRVPAASGAFLSVAPFPGAPRQIVTPPNPLDLGNTGRLEAGAWF